MADNEPVEIKGLPELLGVLNKMPKDLDKGVQDASSAIAKDLVSGINQAAHTPLQRLVVGAIRVKVDKVAVVEVPSTLIKPGTAATDIFYGAEFGGGGRPTTRQFPQFKKRGYFFFPTLSARGRQYNTMWADAIDKASKSWDHKE